VVENSSYKPFRERSIMTDRTIHNNKPDIVLLEEPIKEAYLTTDAAIPDSHNLYSAITERLQKCAE
jgi:hypothetical protein